ncbi:hypothetical protein [Lentzea sp.]|uniref:hypothetical protein n=1 Tax=Lentzea sp. TaxID=56099 RepID=UPI002ED0F1B7
MNTRGLTELVVPSIGVQTGLMNQQLYTLVVVMALVTTTMAAPLLSLLHSPEAFDEDNPAGTLAG